MTKFILSLSVQRTQRSPSSTPSNAPLRLATSACLGVQLRAAMVAWALILPLVLGHATHAQSSQNQTPRSYPEMVILDTDIGDDIDDAFALALALRSPELHILQINSDFGNTAARTRILDRLLAEVGRSDIPVATGKLSSMPAGHFTQKRYGERDNVRSTLHPDAIKATLDLIRAHPGEITLIAIGPLVNVGAMIDADATTFRKLKRVVLMGGSVYRGYGDLGYIKPHGPDPEWNIAQEIPGAQKLFTSGVPIDMMPLDSTQLKLDEVKRAALFRTDSRITDQLVILYHLWGAPTPTLFDPMAVGFVIDSTLCPTEPLHIVVDEHGYTRPTAGRPNVRVCLRSDSEQFFRFYMARLLNPDEDALHH